MATTTTNFGWDIPQSTDLVKDGATAIAALGQDIDTSLLDLKGGTTGQILSKASATDLDYTWIANDAGDITGVTAGTGISGGGTSGTVTVTNSMATAITTAGDLIKGTGSGTFDRLGIGSTGQVLTVAAGAPSWATPGANQTWTLLNAGGTALSGSSTSISGISGKDQIYVHILQAQASSATTVQVTLNADTASNYNSVGQRHFISTTTPHAGTVSASLNSNFPLGITAGSENFSGGVMIFGAATTGIKMVQVNGADGTTNGSGNTLTGFYQGTSAISSIEIKLGGGTWNAGTVYVYAA